MQVVTIYQVKADMTREFGFRRLSEWGAVIDMKSYEVVFGAADVSSMVMFDFGKLSPLDLCEELFKMTNDPSRQTTREVFQEHFGFKGHSISVGDIVKVDDTFYYCDSFGWQEIEVKNVPFWITVGMGASGTYYSDWTPYEVIKVSPSGKTVTLREMDWKITSGSEYNGSAEYEYASNPNNPTVTARPRKHGGWRTPEGKTIVFGTARRYYDPSF